MVRPLYRWWLPALLGLVVSGSAPAAGAAGEHVILLHGLARTDRSMAPLKAALERDGFVVANVAYPSRTARIAELSEQAIGPALEECRREGATTVHFVTHSLGGILVRSYLARHRVPELGHVVMLAPPNQGSELVDVLGGWALFGFVNGPAGRELGTKSDSVPCRLGAVNYSVGVVAGNRSINWINSLLIPGPDDGKVSIERTKLAGMADHLVVPATHPFLMRDAEAIRQTIRFLHTGRFDHPGAPKAAAEMPPRQRVTVCENPGIRDNDVQS
ncbi:esterase/lipase family protein [Opitutus terrae]|uniref:esterase/lipase family protein n=1 Tax=Opitutus terrae TaxID=107709 RepID=UPI001ED8DE61|nr:alpha/beta hydrolase [Opitutus terrae]